MKKDTHNQTTPDSEQDRSSNRFSQDYLNYGPAKFSQDDQDNKQNPKRDPKGPMRRPPIQPPSGRSFRTMSIWLLVAMAILVLGQQVFNSQQAGKEITYTEFWEAIEAGQIEEITITNRTVNGKFRDLSGSEGSRFHTYLPPLYDIELLKHLRGDDQDLTIGTGQPPVKIKAKKEQTPWGQVALTWLPFVLLIGLWFFLIRQMQGGGSAALKFGKSKAKMLHENTIKVTFGDVAGADEAKQELQEVIDFLRDPRKFRRLGGRIPKGVLLVGPPGTGKTLLARAVAGEANVPFFSISGSDFVEMFVGVGASRVRDLFDQGKRSAPCIIFVDELDAVGRHRGAGLGGGHDEREQTLNQLLVEMDGFDANEGVILLAATNRPDVLDPALLRPGRFDRQVVVDRPDVRGREGILKVHAKGKPMSDDVDLKIVARGTPGLSGADLENLLNEAALLAARNNQNNITMFDIEQSKDKVMMGTERRSMVIPHKEKEVTAYHESGHAIVAWFLPETDMVHKVTVIPRGRALGLTHWLPKDDRHTYAKPYLEQTMAAIMGGRAAEEIIFGQITNGAANDIERVTEIAHKMVCEWGMTDKLGPIQYGKRDEMIFLGKEMSQHKNFSENTAETIDNEVNKIVTKAYQVAMDILTEKKSELEKLTEELLDKEILDRDQIGQILGSGNGHDADIEPERAENEVDKPEPVSESPATSESTPPVSEDLTE